MFAVSLISSVLCLATAVLRVIAVAVAVAVAVALILTIVVFLVVVAEVVLSEVVLALIVLLIIVVIIIILTNLPKPKFRPATSTMTAVNVSPAALKMESTGDLTRHAVLVPLALEVATMHPLLLDVTIVLLVDHVREDVIGLDEGAAEEQKTI